MSREQIIAYLIERTAIEREIAVVYAAYEAEVAAANAEYEAEMARLDALPPCAFGRPRRRQRGCNLRTREIV